MPRSVTIFASLRARPAVGRWRVVSKRRRPRVGR